MPCALCAGDAVVRRLQGRVVWWSGAREVTGEAPDPLQRQPLLVLRSVTDPGWGHFSCCKKQEIEVLPSPCSQTSEGRPGGLQADVASAGSFLFEVLQRVREATWFGVSFTAMCWLPRTLFPGLRTMPVGGGHRAGASPLVSRHAPLRLIPVTTK